MKATGCSVMGRCGPIALGAALFLSAVASGPAQTGEAQQVSGEDNPCRSLR